MGFKYLSEFASQDNVDQLLSLIDMVAGTSIDTENVFDIEDALTDSNQMQKCLEFTLQDPDSAQIIKERYDGPEFDLETMLKMPKSSLGFTYATVLKAMHYNPQFYRLREIKSDVDYITHRVRKTHDLHHILTGFSFDDYGEFGVISVTVGQICYPGFTLINLIGLLLSFFSTEETREGIDVSLEYDFDLISQGMKIARQAKPLFPVKWEEGLEISLDEWRAELGIEPVIEGVWSWYSRPYLREALCLPMM